MAASNKPGPIHFVAIGLFMLCIILGVVAFLKQRDYSEAFAREQALKEELGTVQQDRTQKKDEIDALKQILGFSQGVVGLGDEGNEGTVLGAGRAAITKYGQDSEAPTFNETLVAMRAGMDKLTKEKMQIIADYENMKDNYAALQARHEGTESILIEEKDKAKELVLKLQDEKGKEVALRDQEIQRLTNENKKQTLDMANLREDYDEYQRESQEEYAAIERINDELRDKQYQESKYSFEIPDGRIVRVDHNTGLVWLNLGQADGLKPRTSFSVYNKDSLSVGKDISDIKGKIQVTKILGPHESEARILVDQITRPIFMGDLAYTPLWEVGQVNSFSFVGLIDLDGDGISDRDRLHEIISNAGAKIDNEVTDTGERIGEGLTVNTRYLVLGHIPDIEDVVDDEKPAILAMQRLKTEMIKEARENGVAILNLNDFLSFIGYHPSRRVWAPGTDSPFTLEVGKRPTGISAINRYRKSPEESGTKTYDGRRSSRTVNTNSSTRRTDRIFRSTRGAGQ